VSDQRTVGLNRPFRASRQSGSVTQGVVLGISARYTPAPKGRFNSAQGNALGGYHQPLHTSPEGANQPMSQSLARLHVHLVFSTKRRVPWLQEGIRSSMHAYLASVLKDMDCPASLINSVEDHVHILFALGRTTALSVAVEQLKKTSSKWVKTQGLDFAGFGWQAGYGAFSVSESNVATVRRYIADQRAHHQAKTFEDELRALLERHGVEFDERYVWD